MVRPVRRHQHRGDLLAALGMRHAEHERVEHLVELLLEEQLDLAGATLAPRDFTISV